MAKPTSRDQGEEFEEAFRAFLETLIGELGYAWVMKPARRQAGRPQGGRDIDAKWRDAQGNTCYWRFECKSHGGPRPVPLHEVCMHFVETDLADTVDLDCWCPVALNTEFHDAFTDVVSRFNARNLSRLWIELWTPKSNCLHDVLECFPEHHTAILSKSAPTLDPRVRARRLASLKRTIEEASKWGRQRRERAAQLGRQPAAPTSAVGWSAGDERTALSYLGMLTRMRERGFPGFARECCAALAQDSATGAATAAIRYALHREWAECEAALGNDASYSDQLELAGRLFPTEPRGIACHAMAAVSRNHDQDAIGLAEAALGADPNLPMAARALARALHHTGEDQKALEVLRPLLSIHAECAAEAGQIACELGGHDESRAHYEAALTLKNKASYRWALSRALLLGVHSRAGQVPGWRIPAAERTHLERALTLCEGAAEELQSVGPPRVHQAAVLMQAELQALLGMPQEAARTLSRVPSTAGPSWLASRRMLCSVYLQADRVQEALALMTSADWADAGVDDVVERARLLLLADRPAEAIASLSPAFDEKEMASWPVDVIEVYLHAAHTLGKQAERERASAALRDGHPNDPHALVILSALHLRTGAVAEARRALEQAAQRIGPDTPHHVLHSLAHFSDRVGEHARAASLYERLVTAFAPDAMVTAFAYSLAKAERYDDCIRLSREVRTLRAVPPELSRIEAHCLDVGRDDPEAALEVLRQASAVSPDDIATRFEIARIEARLGRGSGPEVAALADRARSPREARAIGELFILCGEWSRAAQHLSEALKKWPTDVGVRDAFLTLAFSAWAESDPSMHPAVAGHETEVQFSLDGVEHTSRITARPSGPSDMEPGAELATHLSGMKPGGSKTANVGGAERILRLVRVASIFEAQARALLKSTDVHPSHVLTKMKISDDFHEVVEMSEGRAQRALFALGLYGSGMLSFAQLSRLWGDELHKTWGSVIGDRGPGLMAAPSPVESDPAYVGAAGSHDKVVLAAPAVFTIVELGIERLVHALLEPMVPNALVESLRRLLLQEKSILREGVGFLSKVAGSPMISRPTKEEIDAHLAWLARVLAFTEGCAHPALTRQLTADEMAIEDNLGTETAVALRIAADLAIPLYSDDAALSRHVGVAGVGRSISTYALLRRGLNAGSLTSQEFTRHLAHLAGLRFDFLPIRVEDLVSAFELDGDRLGSQLGALLGYFSLGKAQPRSVAVVLAKFVTGIWRGTGTLTWNLIVEQCCVTLARKWGASAVALFTARVGESRAGLWTPVKEEAGRVASAWQQMNPFIR